MKLLILIGLIGVLYCFEQCAETFVSFAETPRNRYKHAVRDIINRNGGYSKSYGKAFIEIFAYLMQPLSCPGFHSLLNHFQTNWPIQFDEIMGVREVFAEYNQSVTVEFMVAMYYLPEIVQIPYIYDRSGNIAPPQCMPVAAGLDPSLLDTTVSEMTSASSNNEAIKKRHLGCSSGVVQRFDGSIIHVRNLEWQPISINKLTTLVTYLNADGSFAYHSVGFPFVDLTTMNDITTTAIHYRANDKIVDENKLISKLNRGDKAPQMALTRNLMVNRYSFNQIIQWFQNNRLASSVYYIMGGNKYGEGAVIIHNGDTARINRLDPANGKWFLIHTNFDCIEPSCGCATVDDCLRGELAYGRMANATMARVDENYVGLAIVGYPVTEHPWNIHSNVMNTKYGMFTCINRPVYIP
jgi:hypothetical protein